MSKRGIQYIKQDEPAFLKRMKESVGYSEGDTVDTKKEQLPVDDCDTDSEKEDEKPQIVVLRKGDLSQEDVEELEKEKQPRVNLHLSSTGDSDEEPQSADGKILFKKPKKSNFESEAKSELMVSTKKHMLVDKERKKSGSIGDKTKKDKKLKNKTLLSFDADEEDTY